MSEQLKARGYNVGRRKARRYMTEMAIDPIRNSTIQNTCKLFINVKNREEVRCFVKIKL